MQFKHSSISRMSYSAKVFIGAVPPGTSEQHIRNSIAQFGEAEITWPNKGKSIYPSQGYVFLIFKNAQSVNNLLTQCTTSGPNDKYMFFMQDIQRMVQVRPFLLENATFVIDPLWFRFIRLSVFIGGLPRSCTARDLASSISAKFGKILHASIELDFYHSYPKGAARVVFFRVADYVKAAQASHLMLEINGNTHRVEMKPFFYSGIGCEICSASHYSTDYFCTVCLKYFCKDCWMIIHDGDQMKLHRPLKDSKRELPSSCRNAVCASPTVYPGFDFN